MDAELLAEAKRRGLLPPDRMALLAEAKRRGLSIPTQRQAEQSSMESLAADPPDTSQQPILPGMTGGMVSPASTTMATSMGGSGIGGLTGTIFAPGPGSIGGAVAGGSLGAAAGPPAFNLMENIARKFKGMAPYKPGIKRAFEESAREGVTDAAFSAATLGAGPVINRLGKPLVGKILGVNNPAARKAADIAHAQGIQIGAAHLSPRKFVKGAARVLGVFPFVGTPLRTGQARLVGQIDDRAADLLNTLAPTSTKHALGKALTSKATARHKAANRVAASLYDNFYKVADNLSVKDIIPTNTLKETLAEISQKQGREAITLATGKPMQRFGEDVLGDFLKQVDDLPPMITVEQARGLERTFNEAMGEAGKAGYDISRLGGMKEALEAAKNSIDVTRLPFEEGEEVLTAWKKANQFFHQSRKGFETTTAKRFGRVDKNIFNKGVFKPGTVTADDVFKDVFQARSPEALDDLRKIVGENHFKRASREYLSETFQKSIVPAKEGSLVDELFSAADFEKRLGLKTKEGWDTLKTMLRGTDVKVNDFKNFLDASKTATNITIRDPSTFLTRRLVIGGSLIGGVMVAGSNLSLPAAGLVTYAARKSAKGLMSANQLRALTRVLSDTSTDVMRRTSLVRLVRLLDKDEKPERPTGQLR